MAPSQPVITLVSGQAPPNIDNASISTTASTDFWIQGENLELLQESKFAFVNCKFDRDDFTSVKTDLINGDSVDIIGTTQTLTDNYALLYNGKLLFKGIGYTS